MELSEFVRRTIEEVIAGVKASHDHVLSSGGKVASTNNRVAAQ
jgi:hypothetical protein